MKPLIKFKQRMKLETTNMQNIIPIKISNYLWTCTSN